MDETVGTEADIGRPFSVRAARLLAAVPPAFVIAWGGESWSHIRLEPVVILWFVFMPLMAVLFLIPRFLREPMAALRSGPALPILLAVGSNVGASYWYFLGRVDDDVEPPAAFFPWLAMGLAILMAVLAWRALVDRRTAILVGSFWALVGALLVTIIQFDDALNIGLWFPTPLVGLFAMGLGFLFAWGAHRWLARPAPNRGLHLALTTVFFGIGPILGVVAAVFLLVESIFGKA